MPKLLPLMLLLIAVPGFSQLGMDQDILDVKAVASQDKIVQGEELKIAIILEIKPTLHINSNKPLSEFFIPTEITFDPVMNISFGQPIFPAPELKSFAFSEDKVSIYEGTVVVIVPVSTSPNLALKTHTITGKVAYQGCNDTVCFAPGEKSFELVIDVVAAGTTVQSTNSDYFVEVETETPQTVDEQPDLTAQERQALEYLERGMLGAIIAFFIVGLALNLTPCVYPIIPITVSYFGGQSSTSKRSAFVNALFYLIGIALAFAALGLVSGLAGKQWGFLFQSPWFVVVIGTIILLMAGSLFGAFEITVHHGFSPK